jgi:hypothetical protein
VWLGTGRAMDVNIEKAGEWRESFRGLDREDRFCAQGFLPPVLPGMEVEGVGPVGLPLVPNQAAQIAAVRGGRHLERARRRS